LSLLPLPRVAMAAESKLLDLAGEAQADTLHQQIQIARKNIFMSGQMETTLEEAWQRISVQGHDLDEDRKQIILRDSLKILHENKLIEMKDDNIRSAIPSDGYAAD
jgi:hypothetical protein